MTTFYYGRITYKSDDAEYNVESENDTLFRTKEELVNDIMEGGHFVSFFSKLYEDGIPSTFLPYGDEDKNIEWKDHPFKISTVEELCDFCNPLDDYYTLYFEVLELKLPSTKRERSDHRGPKKAKHI